MDVKDIVEIRDIIDLLDNAVYPEDFAQTDYGPVTDLVAAATEAANRLEALVQGRGHG